MGVSISADAVKNEHGSEKSVPESRVSWPFERWYFYMRLYGRVVVVADFNVDRCTAPFGKYYPFFPVLGIADAKSSPHLANAVPERWERVVQRVLQECQRLMNC